MCIRDRSVALRLRPPEQAELRVRPPEQMISARPPSFSRHHNGPPEEHGLSRKCSAGMSN
eukprot:9793994-Alexandrium_andersonii.AAC.1